MKQVLFFCTTVLVLAQYPAIAQNLRANSTRGNSDRDSSMNYIAPHESVTNGSVVIEDARINYKAVAGTIGLKNGKNVPTASIFYVAYFKTGEADPVHRPLTFLYNGGPGSSTLWLHMGAFGPQRVYLQDTTRTRPPYKTVNNDYSLLDASDLVFIDAPGTGFSKVITKEMGGAGTPAMFYGTDPDANAFADFIVQFLSQYDRWESPKFLFGESYGTFRSAALARVLEMGKGVSLNGIILLSQVLNFNDFPDNAYANPGIDLPYELALPSYAAVAWYHHQLPDQPDKLEPFLREVEHFAMNDYMLALSKGAALDSTTFNAIADKLHNYTGVSVDYIKKARLRIDDMEFEHELLSKDGLITGRLDGRFTGYAQDPLSQRETYDPMDSYIDAAFTAAFNTYVKQELKYGNAQTFQPGGDNVYGQWDYRHRFPGSGDPQVNVFPQVMTSLADAMIYNPDLKVMLNSGYFDMGTPYFEGKYEMEHLPMPAALQKNIEYKRYYSGHMVYLESKSLKLLHDNVAKFIESTLQAAK